jgi:hypothetical protein
VPVIAINFLDKDSLLSPYLMFSMHSTGHCLWKGLPMFCACVAFLCACVGFHLNCQSRFAVVLWATMPTVPTCSPSVHRAGLILLKAALQDPVSFDDWLGAFCLNCVSPPRILSSLQPPCAHCSVPAPRLFKFNVTVAIPLFFVDISEWKIPRPHACFWSTVTTYAIAFVALSIMARTTGCVNG